MVGQAVEHIVGQLHPINRAEHQGNVRVLVDDIRKPEDRLPVTSRIIVMEEERFAPPRSPLVRVLHEDELRQLMEAENTRDSREDESMTFGESVTLLIAIGVLMYLIYALLWPERF